MSEEPPQPASTAELSVDSADVDSLDGIVTALYDSVSFEHGTGPDWDRFRGLFEPSAVLVRIDPRVTAIPIRERTETGFRASSVEDYVTRTTAAIEDGALTAFTERELTRRTEVFADLAQVFSTYERTAEAGSLRRGINSMQLVKDGARWWIVALSWTDEAEPGQLPTRYLPRS
jgi:hypothetical protein